MPNVPDIILASGSAARQKMLADTNLSFRVVPANIDEEALVKEMPMNIPAITEALAKAKALNVSKQHPEALVIGSDQTLDFKGQLLNKAKTKEDAAEKLKSLRGQKHTLHSSVCVVHGDAVLFSNSDRATLTMHNFDDAFLETYMEQDPDALISCVGAYKIEGEGKKLFSEVTGDYYTIMGMPLAPLLSYLETEHGVKP